MLPLAIEVINPGDSANVEVLPAAMRWNGFEVVRTKVTLLKPSEDETPLYGPYQGIFVIAAEIHEGMGRMDPGEATTHVDHGSHEGRSFRQLGSVIVEVRKLILLSSLKDNPRSLTNGLEGQ